MILSFPCVYVPHPLMDYIAIDIISDYIVVNIPYYHWNVRDKFKYQREWITSLFSRVNVIC